MELECMVCHEEIANGNKFNKVYRGHGETFIILTGCEHIPYPEIPNTIKGIWLFVGITGSSSCLAELLRQQIQACKEEDHRGLAR